MWMISSSHRNGDPLSHTSAVVRRVDGSTSINRCADLRWKDVAASSSSSIPISPRQDSSNGISLDQKAFLNVYGTRSSFGSASVKQGENWRRRSVRRRRAGATAWPRADLGPHGFRDDDVPQRLCRDARQAHRTRSIVHAIEALPHFAVLLRKRVGGDTTYKERISVGRARNKDIVLAIRASPVHGGSKWTSAEPFTSPTRTARTERVNGITLFLASEAPCIRRHHPFRLRGSVSLRPADLLESRPRLTRRNNWSTDGAAVRCSSDRFAWKARSTSRFDRRPRGRRCGRASTSMARTESVTSTAMKSCAPLMA